MPYITFRDCPGKKYKCSIRLIRICKDNRISKLSQIAKMTLRDLMALPECGMTTAEVVRKILNDNGLDFRVQQARLSNPQTNRNKKIFTMISEGHSFKSVGEKLRLPPSLVQQIYKNRDRISGHNVTSASP